MGEVRVTPADAALGAEISGVDISGGLSERELLQIRDALLRHSVVVLRDQELSPDDQVAFMDRLYGMRASLLLKSPFAVPGRPEVQIISNITENGRPIGINDAGVLWHTDTCFFPQPEMFVSLYALEIPYRDGMALGDTQWTSVIAAYDALADDIKRELSGRRVNQSFAYSIDKMRRLGILRRTATSEGVSNVAQLHPAVRTHPITGRRLLYVTESFSERIEGLPSDRSSALLEELWAHLIQPRFRFRHSWKKGDFVIWDNCATQHLATFDYADIPRRLHRCGTDGPIPE
jgi:taurine dioxygenase